MANKNNFLRWTGALGEEPFEINAADDNVIFDNTDQFKDVDILDNDSSTYPIDPNSIEVLEVIRYSNATTPAGTAVTLQPIRWLPGTSRLRVWRCTNFSGFDDTKMFIIKYRFSDTLGRQSNIATLYCYQNEMVTSYTYLPSSYTCIKTSGGQNTGALYYQQLILKFSNNVYVLPYDTKPNDIGDPDYVAPTTNTTICPIPLTAYALVQIANNSTGSPLYNITSITFRKTANPDITFVMNLAPGQSAVFNIAVNTYNEILIGYSSLVSVSTRPWFFSKVVSGVSTPLATGTFGGGNPFNISWGAPGAFNNDGSRLNISTS